MKRMTRSTGEATTSACRSRILVLLALLTAMLAVAPSAQADARFVYETCDPQLPAGNPPSVVFRNYWEGSFEFLQTCGSPGGAIGIGQGTTQTFSFALLEAAIPSTPGGWVESLTLSAGAGGFHGNIGDIVRRGKQPDNTSEYWPVPDTGEHTRSFLLQSQPPTISETPAEREVAFDISLSCGYGRTCEPGAYIVAHFLAATEVDPTPPVITGVEGPLVSGDVLRGHQAVQAQATDIGSGVRSLELKINGIAMPGTVAGGCSIVAVENPSYKGVVTTSPTPCPPSLSGAWDVDTSSAPFQTGANTVQVCASDFATKGAPNTACSSPQTVEVDNTCTESPVAGGADLDAGFGGAASDHVTVGFGSGTEITGELTDQGGVPVSGATICLKSAQAGSQTIGQTVETATTDSQGHFALEVKPGPNRRLLVGYRHDSFQIAKTLSVGTRARPSIALSRHKIRGGKRVVISGSLPKPDPGEHVLALQGSSEHGHRWLTFKKVTTDPEGRYRTTYRFIRPTREIGYRIRVVAPAQAGYDYESGASKAARIRVHP
jgi:hypothetical protein